MELCESPEIPLGVLYCTVRSGTAVQEMQAKRFNTSRLALVRRFSRTVGFSGVSDFVIPTIQWIDLKSPVHALITTGWFTWVV